MEARVAVMNLVRELALYRQHVGKSSFFPLEKGVIDPARGLYYRPHPQSVGQGHERRVMGTGGEFFQAPYFDQRKVESVIQGFLRRSADFAQARISVADALGGVDSHVWTAELGLTVLCYYIWTQLSDRVSIESATEKFIAGIQEGDFVSVFRVGLDGICLSDNELLLQQESDDCVILRQPQFDDFPETVLGRRAMGFCIRCGIRLPTKFSFNHILNSG